MDLWFHAYVYDVDGFRCVWETSVFFIQDVMFVRDMMWLIVCDVGYVVDDGIFRDTTD